MTITRMSTEDAARLKAVFPAWSFARSSLDNRVWVQRAPGCGWLPLEHAVDENWRRRIEDARETADRPLSDEEAVERALDMFIEETGR